MLEKDHDLLNPSVSDTAVLNSGGRQSKLGNEGSKGEDRGTEKEIQQLNEDFTIADFEDSNCKENQINGSNSHHPPVQQILIDKGKNVMGQKREAQNDLFHQERLSNTQVGCEAEATQPKCILATKGKLMEVISHGKWERVVRGENKAAGNSMDIPEFQFPLAGSKHQLTMDRIGPDGKKICTTEAKENSFILSVEAAEQPRRSQ